MSPARRSSVSASPSATHTTTPIKRTASQVTPSKQHTTPTDKPASTPKPTTLQSHFQSTKRKADPLFATPTRHRSTPTKNAKPLTSGIHQSHGIYSTADDDSHLSDDEKQQIALEFESFVKRMKTNLTPDKASQNKATPATEVTSTPNTTKRQLFSFSKAPSSDVEELVVVK